MQESFELIAKTFQGLEEVLAQELIELGANDVQIGRSTFYPPSVYTNLFPIFGLATPTKFTKR